VIPSFPQKILSLERYQPVPPSLKRLIKIPNVIRNLFFFCWVAKRSPLLFLLSGDFHLLKYMAALVNLRCPIFIANSSFPQEQLCAHLTVPRFTYRVRWLGKPTGEADPIINWPSHQLWSSTLYWQWIDVFFDPDNRRGVFDSLAPNDCVMISGPGAFLLWTLPVASLIKIILITTKMTADQRKDCKVLNDNNTNFLRDQNSININLFNSQAHSLVLLSQRRNFHILLHQWGVEASSRGMSVLVFATLSGRILRSSPILWPTLLVSSAHSFCTSSFGSGCL